MIGHPFAENFLNIQIPPGLATLIPPTRFIGSVSKIRIVVSDVGGILLVSASLHRMSQHFFRVARNPSRIDAKRGHHFLQADFPLLIAVSQHQITSMWRTINPE